MEVKYDFIELVNKLKTYPDKNPKGEQLSGKQERRENWYKISYQVFLNTPCDTIEGFITLMALSYSWMPTVPGISFKSIEELREYFMNNKILEYIQQVKDGDITNLKILINKLLPIVNNSIVGLSKVLHFVSPKLIPIIDSNVVAGLIKLDIESKAAEIYSLSLNKVIDRYDWYIKEIDRLKNEHKTELRIIETALYYYGQE